MRDKKNQNLNIFKFLRIYSLSKVKSKMFSVKNLKTTVSLHLGNEKRYPKKCCRFEIIKTPNCGVKFCAKIGDS